MINSSNRKRRGFMKDTVTISKSEYERLLKIEAFLEALEVAGVAYWKGYKEAWESFEEGEEQNNG